MQAETTTQTRQARNRKPIAMRKPVFDFDKVDDRFWYGNNGIVTAFLASLSATFPPGEKEFVRSVLFYRDKISDPVLREQMKGFASQEGQHAHQHRLANEWLDSKGFGASELVEWGEKMIEEFVSKSPPAVHLAATVSMEHITAILAHYMLTHPEVTGKMPEPVRELLLWHAVEEIEHKAVAFDVFEAVSGDRDLLRRVFAVSTFYFLIDSVKNTRKTLERLGHRPSLRERLEALDFFMGPRGLIPSVTRQYLSFFRKSFHPWDHDDSALIEEWKAGRPERAAA